MSVGQEGHFFTIFWALRVRPPRLLSLIEDWESYAPSKQVLQKLWAQGVVSGSLITSWHIEQANSAGQVNRKHTILWEVVPWIQASYKLNSQYQKLKACINKHNGRKDNLSAVFQPQTSEYTLLFSGPACQTQEPQWEQASCSLEEEPSISNLLSPMTVNI